MCGYSNIKVYTCTSTSYIYIGEEPVILSNEPEWMQQLLQSYLNEMEPSTDNIYGYMYVCMYKSYQDHFKA